MITIYHFNDKVEKTITGSSLNDYSQSHLEASHNIIRSDSVPHKSHCVPKILTPRCNDKFGSETLHMGSRSVYNESASSVNMCLEKAEL